MKSVPPTGLLLKPLEWDAGLAEVGKPDRDPPDVLSCGLASAKGAEELEGWLAADGIAVDPSDPRLPD